jgi:hypothetical protein
VKRSLLVAGGDDADEEDLDAKRRRILAETRDIDADDSEEDEEDSDDDDDDSDDDSDAELQRELDRVRREREEKKKKEVRNPFISAPLVPEMLTIRRKKNASKPTRTTEYETLPSETRSSTSKISP